MAAIKPLLCLSIVLFFCFNAFSLETEHGQPLDDDLAFLEQEEKNEAVLSQLGSNHQQQEVQAHQNNDESSDSDDEDDDRPEPTPTPEIDESDVIELKGSNFSEFVAKNRYVLVEFYAPWCGHCQALAPEYAAAATALKEEGGAVLAKIDATQERELSEKYGVEGSPTLLFFVDGVHKPYLGQRTKDAIVTWVKKKLGPGLYNVTTTEEAERILTAESKLVLGFLDNLAGPESEELDAASKLEDNINFYQTSDVEVAKMFHIDPQGKRPALVMIKKEAEKVSHFGGQFVKAAIAEFVIKNKLPLVNIFTRETASLIFESSIKKQLLLFATAKNSKKLLPKFQEAAKDFLGKLIFVFVDINNEDVGKPVSNYFGVTGEGPRVIAYTGNGAPRKFVLDGEVTLDSIKSFAENVLQDKLKPFYKSDPVPKTNDGDVKIVVGKNFEEIVLDESKDVLLEIYAPWCGHCQALEPIYNNLAKYLRGIDSLVIAKMDGVANEHPRAKVEEGFPTLLFFPAGNKSFDPIPVDSDRTVVAFYKFLKKHAAIPFKLQRPASTQKSTASDATDGPQLSSDELKDEL